MSGGELVSSCSISGAIVKDKQCAFDLAVGVGIKSKVFLIPCQKICPLVWIILMAGF